MGKLSKKDFLNRCGDRKITDKLLVTGHPTFDLDQEKYRNIYRKINPHKHLKPYVLINTNFLASTVPLKDIIENGRFPENMSREVTNYYTYSENAYKDFKKNIHHLIEKFSDEIFLIRLTQMKLMNSIKKNFLSIAML